MAAGAREAKRKWRGAPAGDGAVCSAGERVGALNRVGRDSMVSREVIGLPTAPKRREGVVEDAMSGNACGEANGARSIRAVENCC